MKNTFLTIGLVLSTILASATPFITRWDLSKFGPGANQINFNDTITGFVNYTWETVPVSSNYGTGTLSNNTTTISGLPANAIIRLKIDSANFNVFNIGATDFRRLVDVEQWGTVKWTSMYNAFNDCTFLNISASDIPNLSNVTNMGHMFAYCSTLNGPNNMNSWNTSNMTDMSYMFYNATSFNQPLNKWNTSNVTDMSGMFYFASSFNQPLSKWNTSNVTDMSSMFLGATSFNQPIGDWKTSNVTNMEHMFYNSISFSQPIGNWNLSQVTNMLWMLVGSGMNCPNYSATLHGWANNIATHQNVFFNPTNIHYGTNAVADRNTLINSKGWTFNGDIADATACNATGINNISLTNNITLSPNPTHTTFQLSTKEPLNIQLYNTMGQMVLTASVNSGASAASASSATAATAATAAATSVTEPAEVNIAHLPSGLYLIKEAKTGLIIGKIMKE